MSNLCQLTKSLLAELEVVVLRDNISSVEYYEHMTNIVITHNKTDEILISLFDDAMASICCNCHDGSVVCYPICDTPQALFMHLGMAMEFSNQRTIRTNHGHQITS